MGFTIWNAFQIKHANLDSGTLRLKKCGVDDIHGFDLMDVPSREHIEHSLILLAQLGAIDRNFKEEWCYANFLNFRTLQYAGDVRNQLANAIIQRSKILETFLAASFVKLAYFHSSGIGHTPQARKGYYVTVESQLNRNGKQNAVTDQYMLHGSSVLYKGTLDIEGVVAMPDNYVFVVHYFSLENRPIVVDVLIQNEHFGDALFHYCPSMSGCRTIVMDKTHSDQHHFRLDDKYVLIFYSNQTHQKWPIYIDYLMAVPLEPYTDKVLRPLPLDLVNEFVDKCSDDNFHNLPSNASKYCRQKIFSLTTEFNATALACDYNIRETLDFPCAEYGGQCKCKPNVIGRKCDRCAAGYYNFPDCIKCKCGLNHQCDEKNGQCLAGYYAFTECRECDCEQSGTTDDVCKVRTARCLCKKNVIGPRCDQYRPGTFDLRKSDLYGYSECFCVTDRCRSSNWPIQTLRIPDEAWSLKIGNKSSTNGTILVEDGRIVYAPEELPMEVTFEARLQPGMDYTRMYGLHLSYVISSFPNSDRPKTFSQPDFVGNALYIFLLFAAFRKNLFAFFVLLLLFNSNYTLATDVADTSDIDSSVVLCFIDEHSVPPVRKCTSTTNGVTTTTITPLTTTKELTTITPLTTTTARPKEPKKEQMDIIRDQLAYLALTILCGIPAFVITFCNPFSRPTKLHKRFPLMEKQQKVTPPIGTDNKQNGCFGIEKCDESATKNANTSSSAASFNIASSISNQNGDKSLANEVVAVENEAGADDDHSDYLDSFGKAWKWLMHFDVGECSTDEQRALIRDFCNEYGLSRSTIIRNSDGTLRVYSMDCNRVKCPFCAVYVVERGAVFVRGFHDHSIVEKKQMRQKKAMFFKTNWTKMKAPGKAKAVEPTAENSLPPFSANSPTTNAADQPCSSNNLDIERGEGNDDKKQANSAYLPPTLFEAIKNGDIWTISKSLDGGTDVNAKEQSNGNNLLQMAVMTGTIELVELLLNRGADVNETNDEGKSAVQIAQDLHAETPDEKNKKKYERMVKMLKKKK
ncbi:hypothetical protein niasHS_013048 [Heterodera schachtii]|uniref:Laminin EGF-like domain-containing protein n=1 Tax=Heterodera schachtii TaxID=97005 RepID=A0ABD2IA05_HETSC